MSSQGSFRSDPFKQCQQSKRCARACYDPRSWAAETTRDMLVLDECRFPDPEPFASFSALHTVPTPPKRLSIINPRYRCGGHVLDLLTMLLEV